MKCQVILDLLLACYDHVHNIILLCFYFPPVYLDICKNTKYKDLKIILLIWVGEFSLYFY